MFREKFSDVEANIILNLNESLVNVHFGTMDLQQLFLTRNKIEYIFAMVSSLLEYLEKSHLVYLFPVEGPLRGTLTLRFSPKFINPKNKRIY